MSSAEYKTITKRRQINDLTAFLLLFVAVQWALSSSM